MRKPRLTENALLRHDLRGIHNDIDSIKHGIRILRAVAHALSVRFGLELDTSVDQFVDPYTEKQRINEVLQEVRGQFAEYEKPLKSKKRRARRKK